MQMFYGDNDESIAPSFISLLEESRICIIKYFARIKMRFYKVRESLSYYI